MKDNVEVRAFDVPGYPDPGTDEATFRRMREELQRRYEELKARHAAQAKDEGDRR